LLLTTNGHSKIIQDDPEIILFLTQQLKHSLLTQGAPTSNRQLVLNAKQKIDYFYYELAHKYFVSCQEAPTEKEFQENIEKAIQAALHLVRDFTQTIEDDFNTNFKITLVENYLAGIDTDPPCLSKELLLLLANSHRNPAQVYKVIKQIKQEQESELIGAVMQCAPHPIVYSRAIQNNESKTAPEPIIEQPRHTGAARLEIK